MFRLSKRSMKNLEGVHPDLIKVVELAIKRTEIDFAVIDGLRTVDEQKKLVESGASQTMNSRHLTGHAVDLAAYVGSRISWEWPLYEKVADAMLASAAELGIPLIWGGNWTTIKDGPHFELNRNFYKGD